MTFEEITNKLNEIYTRKNKDYGNSFEKSCEEFGLVSPAIRMTDKLNRFKQLINSKPEVDESIQDTLLDLANYAILTYKYITDSIEINKELIL